MMKAQTENSYLVPGEESPVSYSTTNVNDDANSKTPSGTEESHQSKQKSRAEWDSAKPDENEEGGDVLKLRSLPKKSLYTLLLIGLGNFLFGIEFYFVTPFYPKVARMKGASETTVGFVFGILHITIFITSPIYGNFLPKLGPRFVYIAGILSGGAATVIFGLLGYCASGAPFIALSFICRFIIGLSISAFVTASVSILTHEFPKHVSRAFGLAEIANGIGFMTGPAIGGGFYEVGGFGLPSFIVGCLVILNGILLYVCLPAPKGKISPRRGTILTLMRSPLVLVSLLNVFLAALGICFIEPTLATHLENFNMSTGIVGLVFVIAPFVYGSTASLTGYVADTKNVQHIQYYLGGLAFGIGYLFIGPSPMFVGLPLRLWLVIICLILLGFAYGSCIIPALKCMITGAIEIGFADNLETYGFVSGAFYSALFLGGFLGNILGGVLVEAYGYPTAATVVGFIALAVTAITMVYFTVRNRRKAPEARTDELTETTDRDNDCVSEATHPTSPPNTA